MSKETYTWSGPCDPMPCEAIRPVHKHLFSRAPFLRSQRWHTWGPRLTLFSSCNYYWRCLVHDLRSTTDRDHAAHAARGHHWIGAFWPEVHDWQFHAAHAARAFQAWICIAMLVLSDLLCQYKSKQIIESSSAGADSRCKIRSLVSKETYTSVKRDLH